MQCGFVPENLLKKVERRLVVRERKYLGIKEINNRISRESDNFYIEHCRFMVEYAEERDI